ACAPPSAPRRRPARACGRRGPRSCARPSRGRSSRRATRCAPSASSRTRRETGSAPAADPQRTAPSSSFCSPLLLPATSAADDQLVGVLVLRARALAERRHAPGRDRVSAALRLALAAPVRVVDGVHRGAAHRRPLPEPAAAAGLAAGDVAVVEVADLSDRGAAGEEDAPRLTRGEAQRRVARVLGDELDARTGGARELTALAGL